MMQTIGLISDTHGRLNNKVFELFAGVDLILHAGDIGGNQILTELETIAPVKAVLGNMDSYALSASLQPIEFISVDDHLICLTHIVNNQRAFAYKLFKMNRSADIVVYGHTHRAAENRCQNILFLNPGSASQPRYAKPPSVALLTFPNGQPHFSIEYL